MPGITGIIKPTAPLEARRTLESMTAAMRHAPTHVSGATWFESLGSGVGWVSHPGSFSDQMPAWNESGDVSLVLFGEDFPAEGPAIEPNGGSASRYLLRRYEQLGDGFFATLNGTFAGLLADMRKGHERLVLFNDRYGLGRIYFRETDGGFYFASEAKALLTALPELRKVDHAALGEMITCGCVLQDRTLFPGISLLPPAAAWQWRSGRVLSKLSYFNPSDWEQLEPLPAEDYYELLKSTLIRVTPRYFSGRQEVAVSVTGGVDSRMVMAAARPRAGSIKTYTFGGMYRESADVRMGRLVAAACGQEHYVLPLTRDFFTEFGELAARSVYLTDGTMDVTGAVSLSVHRAAQQLAPVRLTGNYGGEILRGITALKSHGIHEDIFTPDFCTHIANARRTLTEEKQCPRASFIAFKQMRWHHFSRLAIEQSQLTVRTPYLDNELVPLAYQMPVDLQLNKAMAYQFIADTLPALAAVPTDRGTVYSNNLRSKGAAYKIRRWLEEFLPRAEYAYDYGMPHWLARLDRIAAPLHIERLFLGRQKFYHFRLWYRGVLAAQVKEILLDPRTLGRPYVRRKQVEALVSRHTRGEANYTTEIHKLMTFELIQRQLIEQPSFVPSCT